MVERAAEFRFRLGPHGVTRSADGDTAVARRSAAGKLERFWEQFGGPFRRDGPVGGHGLRSGETGTVRAAEHRVGRAVVEPGDCGGERADRQPAVVGVDWDHMAETAARDPIRVPEDSDQASECGARTPHLLQGCADGGSAASGNHRRTARFRTVGTAEPISRIRWDSTPCNSRPGASMRRTSGSCHPP